MEEKDQNVNTAPESQEPSQIEEEEKTQENEGQSSPSATTKVHKTVPMIPHDRKVTFRKKQPQEENKTPDTNKEVKGGPPKYVKKDEMNQETTEEEKKAYVDMKPQEKKFVYQKKGAIVEKQPKMERQSKSEKLSKPEQNQRPVSLSRSIMRQSSFDFSSKPKKEEKKMKEQGADSPQDKKVKPKFVKKAANPMNFQQLEQYFASQPKQRASSFTQNHSDFKTSTLYRLPPGFHQAKSTPFNFEQPVGGFSRPLALPNNPPTFKPGPVKLKVQSHSFTPSEGIDLASLVNKAPSFTPQS